MSKTAKMWILILAAGLVAGILGIIQYGWQHPGDTIGAAVWIVLALSVAVMIRRESRS
jgi:hypothetical protein